jgi:hypothetical protein
MHLIIYKKKGKINKNACYKNRYACWVKLDMHVKNNI